MKRHDDLSHADMTTDSAEDEMLLDALDRELGVDRQVNRAEEFARLRELAHAVSSLERVEPPDWFTSRVMANLPERRTSAWSRVANFFTTSHTIRLNFTWAAAALLLLGLVSFKGLPWSGPLLGNWNLTTASPTATMSQPGVVPMRFAVRAPDARSIALAGDFNGWRHDQIHMRPSEADGVWTVIVPLRPGRYQYMFVVNGKQWLTDPLADGHYDDGFGNRNAVVEVRPERRKAI